MTQPEVVCGNSLQPDSHPVGVTMGVTVPSGFPKQAIVVIHGMGEQKPMDTIKNFAHAVWTADSEVHKNGLRDSGEIWSKPDDRTGSLEAGKWADVIAVQGDPLKDIRLLQHVQFVMKSGVVYKNDSAPLKNEAQ